MIPCYPRAKRGSALGHPSLGAPQNLISKPLTKQVVSKIVAKFPFFYSLVRNPVYNFSWLCSPATLLLLESSKLKHHRNIQLRLYTKSEQFRSPQLFLPHCPRTLSYANGDTRDWDIYLCQAVWLILILINSMRLLFRIGKQNWSSVSTWCMV